MLLCLLWSGPVCIIFWSEWCHCDSVVMVICAFIVSSHRSEGCRRITHPPDCCSGPLNPPSVTPKLTNWDFFPSSESSWMTEDFTQRERTAGICHFPSARTPLRLMFLHLYPPQQALLPASFCKAWWEQDPPPPPSPLSIKQPGAKLVRRAGWRQREGGMGGWDWMMVAIVTELVLEERWKTVKAIVFDSIITSFY